MSDTTTNGRNGQEKGVYGAATDAIGSVAEKVRAAAPDTYDAGAKAARYVGETAFEHPVPVLAGAAALAFVGWLLTKSSDNRSATVTAFARPLPTFRERPTRRENMWTRRCANIPCQDF